MKLRIARKVMKRVYKALSRRLVVHEDGSVSIQAPMAVIRKAAGRLSTYYRAHNRVMRRLYTGKFAREFRRPPLVF